MNHHDPFDARLRRLRLAEPPPDLGARLRAATPAPRSGRGLLREWRLELALATLVLLLAGMLHLGPPPPPAAGAALDAARLRQLSDAVDGSPATADYLAAQGQRSGMARRLEALRRANERIRNLGEPRWI